MLYNADKNFTTNLNSYLEGGMVVKLFLVHLESILLEGICLDHQVLACPTVLHN